MVSGLSTKTSESKHGFLQFSQKLDYGLFLLIELAQMQQWPGLTPSGRVADPLSLRTFAEANGMSFLFMQKAAFELRKGGLITADRGKNGGYLLAKPATQVTLKEIIEVLEGPLSVMHCLIPSTSSTCSRKPGCRMRHGLGTVNEAIVNIFTQTTLYNLLNPLWKPNV